MSRKMLRSKRFGSPDGEQIEHKQQHALEAKAADCIRGYVSGCSQQAQGSDPLWLQQLFDCIWNTVSSLSSPGPRSAFHPIEMLEQAQWAALRWSGENACEWNLRLGPVWL